LHFLLGLTIAGDPLIHREVANAINGLVDFLKAERRL